jgi:Carboxylesterase family
MKMRLRAIGSRRDDSGKAVFAVPGVTAFEGIPSAAAPVGKLRWASPQPVPSWPVVRNAHRFMSGCVQNYMGQILWLSWATMKQKRGLPLLECLDTSEGGRRKTSGYGLDCEAIRAPRRRPELRGPGSIQRRAHQGRLRRLPADEKAVLHPNISHESPCKQYCISSRCSLVSIPISARITCHANVIAS